MYFSLSIEDEVLILNQYIGFLKQKNYFCNFGNTSILLPYLRSKFVSENIQESYQEEVMIILSKIEDLDEDV